MISLYSEISSHWWNVIQLELRFCPRYFVFHWTRGKILQARDKKNLAQISFVFYAQELKVLMLLVLKMLNINWMNEINIFKHEKMKNYFQNNGCSWERGYSDLWFYFTKKNVHTNWDSLLILILFSWWLFKAML